MTIPPPMPVLTVTKITFPYPRPAPNRCSPSAARFASFPMAVGTSRWPRNSATTGVRDIAGM